MNVSAALVDVVKTHSPGQISHALHSSGVVSVEYLRPVPEGGRPSLAVIPAEAGIQLQEYPLPFIGVFMAESIVALEGGAMTWLARYVLEAHGCIEAISNKQMKGQSSLLFRVLRERELLDYSNEADAPYPTTSDLFQNHSQTCSVRSSEEKRRA